MMNTVSEKLSRVLAEEEEEINTVLFVADAVKATRLSLEDNWPTPDTEDSLAFAVTESGETVDASLRLSSRYRRNRKNGSTVEEELADTAIMLVTALSTTLTRNALGAATKIVIRGGKYDMTKNGLAKIAHWTANAYYEFVNADYINEREWIYSAVTALVHTLRSMDHPRDSVLARLDRIEKKWGEKTLFPTDE